MNANKEEFIQWKDSYVTKEVFEIIRERQQESKEILASQAGIDPQADRFLCGMIHAFGEVLNVDYEGEDN